MAGLSRDWEADGPEHPGHYFSWILCEKSGSREMAFGNADPYPSVGERDIVFVWSQ